MKENNNMMSPKESLENTSEENNKPEELINSSDDSTINIIEEDKEEINDSSENEMTNDTNEEKTIDYHQFSLEELVKKANDAINNYEYGKTKKIIDLIKSTFYSKINTEIEKIKVQFIEDGGKDEDFLPQANPLEETFKELLKIFKEKRANATAKIEKEKEENYKKKLDIIEQITNLVNSTEHFRTVYNQFKTLQQDWKEIKEVPQSKNNELHKKYQFSLNLFYDYLKINNELRDYDLKHNLSQKIAICEKAEQLSEEKNIRTVFANLQDLHQKWKNIGPVPEIQKEELWERFKAATKVINKKFQDYQIDQKKIKTANLTLKTQICELVDDLNTKNYTTPKEWEEGSKKIIEQQTQWRTIGMVPSKYNDSIYKRFKAACDQFFKNKNEYYKILKSKQKDQITAKIELIKQVEALQNDTNWKETTSKIIQLQKDWKKTGPIPRSKSESLWKKFRAACDVFFTNKENAFKEIHGDENENLEKKKALVEEIQNYKHDEDNKKALEQLKEFQNKWKEIGYVPLKSKREIQEQYRVAINKQFDALNIDIKEKDLIRLRVKLEAYKEGKDAENQILSERYKVITKLKHIESDIQQWENNIGFFSSGAADTLLKEYQNKIEVAKKNVKILKDKIKLIDSFL